MHVVLSSKEESFSKAHENAKQTFLYCPGTTRFREAVALSNWAVEADVHEPLGVVR